MFISVGIGLTKTGNKGSSTNFAKYLEKEDMEQERQALKNGKLPEKRTGFFNQEQDGITKDEVIERIDNNKKALGKNDAKYYSLVISPTEKEQKFLLSEFSTEKEVNSIKDLSNEELKQYEDKLKNFSRGIMDKYAENFERDRLKSGDQLVYFGKVEHQRKHKGTDKEVLDGKAKTGELKKGLQSHIHIIVSRKDKEQKLKLSPLANEKSDQKLNSKLNGKKVKRGFNRVRFKEKTEQLFDKMFSYKRTNKETVRSMIDNSKKPKIEPNKIEKPIKQITPKKSTEYSIKYYESKKAEIRKYMNDQPKKWVKQQEVALARWEKNPPSKKELDKFTDLHRRIRKNRDYEAKVKIETDKEKETYFIAKDEDWHPAYHKVDYKQFEKEWEKNNPITKSIDFEI